MLCGYNSNYLHPLRHDLACLCTHFRAEGHPVDSKHYNLEHSLDIDNWRLVRLHGRYKPLF
jgi:hypothetical protein